MESLTPATIDKIEELSDASKHTVIRQKGSTEVIVRYADGVQSTFTEYVPRNHTIHSIEDIKNFLDYSKNIQSGAPIVWIGRQYITVVMDDHISSTRENVATLPFTHSPEYTFLTSLKESVFTQGQFLKLCRVKLYDCFLSSDDRLRWISMLKTVSRDSVISQGTQANYATNKVEAEWPDFLELAIRVIDDPFLKKQATHRIRVHVEVSSTGQFELIPNQSDMKNSLDDEIDLLVNHLLTEAKDYPIFRGKP